MLAELGVRVGHWSDPAARTGCTVVLLPPDSRGSAEIRGGAPAGRELAPLAPHRSVAGPDAILITGGSAFGLAAADGVMRYCQEHDRGVATPAGRVPVVPALALFDLAVGDGSVRPGPDQGYAACHSADTDPTWGRVGAGSGATVGQALGPAGVADSGIACHTATVQDLAVTAVVAVNAFGTIDTDGSAATRIARTVTPDGLAGPGLLGTNTTIGVVITNARLDKTDCLIVAQGAHGGLATAIAPAHTRFDGDAFVAVSVGDVTADVDVVRLLATTTVAAAIRSLA